MARDAVVEVRERSDIVEIVSGYVPLKRAGRSYKGLCPFHQEKTPSFVVFPDSQNFHCFGCGRGGDVFTFYQGVEHVEFPEALRELAQRAGVTLASMPTVAPEVDAHRHRLIELNQLAAAFYANILTNSEAGAPGRAVTEQRGLSAEIIGRFGLGFALDRWDALVTYLTHRGTDLALAHEAGLLQERQTGGYYDRFRNRLMFPIRNRDGAVVGFGARALGDAQPKYLNSPQSAIFDKSMIVYGLDLAKEEIRRRDQVVIVEGYMDAIAAHQYGHANAVATMGTALTEPQVGTLKRLTKNLVLALDADAAGQMATLRGLETMHEALDAEAVPVPDPFGMIRFERKLDAQISIVRLPEGKDPDEMIRRSPEEWPHVVASAQPFLTFFVEAVTDGINLDDPRAKAEAVSRIAPVLRQVGDRVVQSHYIGDLAARLRLDQRVILAEVRKGALRAAAPSSPSSRSSPVVRASNEDHLLALLLRHRTLCAEIIAAVPIDDLVDSRNRELLKILADPSIPDLEPEQLIAGLDDTVADHAERLLESLAKTPAQVPGQVVREARQTLDLLGKERFVFLMRQLQANISIAEAADDKETLVDLSGQLATLYERHRTFYPPRSPYFRDSRDQVSVG